MIYDRLYMRIDLDRIRDNFQKIQKRAGDAGVVCVIKADAYGHGAKVIANLLEKDMAMAAVAGVTEALELRKECPSLGGLYGRKFTKPILVIGFTHPSMYRLALENDVILAVSRYSDALQLSEIAAEMGKIAEVHLAVDSGMRRIGLIPSEESIEEAERIAGLPNVRITGIFSHFARADEKAGKEATEHQLNVFENFCTALEARGISVGVRHISNSAAILGLPGKYHLVRAGIILYGHYPSDEVDQDCLDVRPAMSVITRIVNIFTLKKGEGVSYGHTYVADRDRTVATLSCGYADGIFRTLSNRGHVLIRGRRCPILGRICMDQMMVDISHVPEAELYDEAVIIGESGGEEITAEEYAAPAGSFNYEVLCEFGRRVPKVYILDDQEIEEVSYLS